MTSKAEKAHLDKVAALGCVVCRNLGHGPSPAEIHHLRENTGIGNRASDFETIPLCFLHHNAGIYGVSFHAGPKIWEKQYGKQRKLLEQTERELKEQEKMGLFA